MLARSWEVGSSNSVRPSVRLSVIRVLWQNQTMHLGYFDTTRKPNHSSFLTPTKQNASFRLKFMLKVTHTHPFEKRRLWQISAYNVSTVRDSEKSSIMTNRKSTTGFPTSYRWNAHVTPKCPKGWLKERFLGILKRATVTPAVYLRFLEFIHVGIQSTRRTLSRPWSRPMVTTAEWRHVWNSVRTTAQWTYRT